MKCQPPPPGGGSYDTPVRLTQYDKDVAVYKQAEPASQVSSSTDSGYGHLYDRMHGENGSRYSGEFAMF